jgi:hypothetical protein
MAVGFSNLTSLVDAQIADGKYQISSFRKVSAIATTAGTWADLSMSTGNPKPNYYVGPELESTVLNGNNGVYHGQNVGVDSSKHLSRLTMMCVTAAGAPSSYQLLDYLLFYPLIDMDVTDPQDLVNSVPLPRYSTGAGVKAMLVATNPYVGGQTYTISYTNSDGVAGRTSIAMVSNTATTIGTLISGSSAVDNSYGPFIALQAGDTGIRSVEQITFSGSNGGLATLVLVKPLANTIIRERTAPVEVDYFKDTISMPRIYDGAYLNFIVLPMNSLATVPILGDATFIWS